MPDWTALVRQRVGAVDFCGGGTPAEEGEIVAELAAHLEDRYDELCGKGMREPDAIDHTVGEIDNWRLLATRIRRARRGEETMNHRTRALWLPGLIILTASMGWLWILQRMTFGPRMPAPWLHASLAFMPYLVWLISQPLFGAAGAYLARRAGAERRTELTASLFPAIVMLGLWVTLIACITVTRYSHVSHQWPLVFAGALFWSVLPGLAMLLGRFVYIRMRNYAGATP
jgi:hypothetical protein